MNKKGFTLIELLTVIVVLGVIASITVPIVLRRIEDSTRKSFEIQAKIVLRTISDQMLEKSGLNAEGITLTYLKEQAKLSVSNYESLKVRLIGDKPFIILYGKHDWANLVAYGTYDKVDISSTSDYAENTTAPTITLVGNSSITVGKDSTYVESGATYSDDKDTQEYLANNYIVSGKVKTSIPGDYVLTYTIYDSSGNKASVQRTVTVLDYALLDIAFGTNGSSNPAKTRSTTVTVSGTNLNASSLKYLWSTATATPSEGSFSSTFTNGGNITSASNLSGTYYLWILAKDTSGNPTMKSSKAFILDNEAPMIVMNGTSMDLALNSTYQELGAKAYDNIDGNLTSSIVKSGTVNTGTAGTYTITYQATDTAGNSKTETRTVVVSSAKEGAVFTFSYTGGAQTFTVPVSGNYFIELWGAQGGAGVGSSGGGGAYAAGNIYLEKGRVLYIHTGSVGGNSTSTTTQGAAGYNGGGIGGVGAPPGAGAGAGGGGATHIASSAGILSSLSTNPTTIIMVAGGGGGGGTNNIGGAGGGIGGPAHTYGGAGGSGRNVSGGGGSGGYYGYGGAGGGPTPGAGGSIYSTTNNVTGYVGAFGIGGAGGGVATTNRDGGGGGGGGYYGGGGGAGGGGGSSGAGGGGSSYIDSIISNPIKLAGNQSMPSPAGGVQTGNSGNGYAKLTYIKPSSEKTNVDVLVVAGGGGGGGRHGGGGGGGGFIETTINNITTGHYFVTVGGGGIGASSDSPGSNGGNSSVFGLTAIGGGGGGSWDNVRAGYAGGSGGGATYCYNCGAGNFLSVGTIGQGNNGGSSQPDGYGQGAGGGGAGSVGKNALNNMAGDGGAGKQSLILGIPYYFAAGGGGGAWGGTCTWNGISPKAGDAGIGGAGGGGFAAECVGTIGLGSNGGLNLGGNGISSNKTPQGGDAGANTGSGGGGGGANNPNTSGGVYYSGRTGGNGGSGIVVIRYLGSQRATGGTVTSSGGYTIHTFTNVGTSAFVLYK